MELEVVNFKTAQLASEKKFTGECLHSYSDDGTTLDSAIDQNGNLYFDEKDIKTARGYNYNTYLAPSQTHLQRWLREEHNIEINITQNINVHVEYYYFPSIVTLAPNKLSLEETEIKGLFMSYEEALEEGLQEALKLVP